MIHGRKQCYWQTWKVELLQRFQDGTALVQRRNGQIFRTPYEQLRFKVVAA